MSRKIYATRGLIDFTMALNVGGAILRLCFSGGSMGSNGIISAKYTTDNKALQRMIEKSKQFDKGLIYLYDEMPLGKEGHKNKDEDGDEED